TAAATTAAATSTAITVATSAAASAITTAATATVAAAVTTTTTTEIAGPAIGPRPGFIYSQVASREFLAVKLFDRCRCFFRSGHFHKAKAAGATRHPVFHYR